jgi:helix-turn-helix protein
LKKEPQARDRIIGARVRAIRTERVGLSLERAAEIAQWPPAKLSRTERGLRHVTIQEVATLLTAWELPHGPGKVVGAGQGLMWRSWRGRVKLRALWRSAAAMLVLPARRRVLMARLRRLAMMRGPLWVRMWEASSW